MSSCWRQFRKAVGLEKQNNSRGILTDAFLAVKGCDDCYAIGTSQQA